MVLIAVNLHAPGDFLDLSVHTNVQITLASHGFEEFAVVALTTAYQWGENEDLFPLIVVQNHVDDLLLGIFHHLFTRHITVCLSGTGIEQTQIVVNLCCRSYGGTGITVGGLLFDADDGGETCYLVDIRAFHPS